MSKSKITDYSRAEFQTMTVEITYRNHDKMYSLSVPAPGNKVRGKTLSADEKGQLWDKLTTLS